MTNEMFTELVNDLKRKNRILIVCLIVSILLLIGMSIVAFSQFEMNYTETNDYVIETDATTGDGDGGEVSQNVDLSSENNPIYIICATVILCMVILCVGVVLLHGKSARTYKDKNSKNENFKDN